jgi:putative endonuclease
MKYGYILETEDGRRFYVGITNDIEARLKAHNAGHVPHTAKFGPWRLRTFIAFSDEAGAFAFASGRAFAAKRF